MATALCVTSPQVSVFLIAALIFQADFLVFMENIVDQSVILSPAPNPAGSGLRPTDLSQWPICADDAGCSDVHILYLCPWPVSVQCRSVSFTGVGLEICI